MLAWIAVVVDLCGGVLEWCATGHVWDRDMFSAGGMVGLSGGAGGGLLCDFSLGLNYGLGGRGRLSSLHSGPAASWWGYVCIARPFFSLRTSSHFSSEDQGGPWYPAHYTFFPSSEQHRYNGHVPLPPPPLATEHLHARHTQDQSVGCWLVTLATRNTHFRQKKKRVPFNPLLFPFLI
jgi:hypothetical protein